MNHLMTLYHDETQLRQFIQENAIADTPHLLIQLFTAHNDEESIRTLLAPLQTLFKEAVIVGATTDGEIIHGSVVTHETVLSFTTFEHTTLTSAYSEAKESFQRGSELASKLLQDDTRLMILFSDGLSTNGEGFLEGVNSVAPGVMVAGGLAGDYAKFEKTFVFTKERILNFGAVGVALHSQRLSLYNDYCFNWQKIGKALTITKCDGNRVYEIDGRSAVETYTHYLGQEVADLLPSIGVEFPLISSRGGMDVARAVLAKYDDGSLGFAGNIIEGEQVYLGYGNLKKILEDSHRIPAQSSSFQAEAIFVYSCMARRNFIGNVINQELEPLEAVAPTCGFFTYGEFFYRQKGELLNQTMTVVALRESEKKPTDTVPQIEHDEGTYHSVNALIHLLNVTSQEMMEHRVFAKSYERFAQLFESSGDGLVVLNAMRTIECNEKALTLFGYTKEEKEAFLQTHFSNHVVRIEKVEKMVKGLKEGQSHSQLFTLECIGKDKKPFWAEVMLTRVVSGNERYDYMVLRDISERKAMEETLKQQHRQLYNKAYQDDLTGLPNRKSIMELLEEEITKAKRSQKPLALFFIDLDKLKVVNDSLGHLAGDKLIQFVAKRFRRALSPDITLARLGGDEFLVLLKDATEEKIITEVERLLRISREEIRFEKNHLFISASIGIARFPHDGDDAYKLLKHADAAMYEAKEHGGDQYRFYNTMLTQKAYAQIRINKEFRRGIKKKEFEVYYQPQFEIKTGKMIGVEALIRWNHPEKGFLIPEKFLPSIEKANLLQRLDHWLMNKAMKDMVKLYTAGLCPGILSLNIRMSDLENLDWEKRLLKSMRRIGFKPEWLEIEITETEIMKQPQRVIDLIKTLHQHNITVAIDDFGTGYSSLAQLKYLPFDKLKIDKLFIDDLPHSNDACVLFGIMMTLANNLHVSVVAEGMEREEQVAYLTQSGCQYAQGYYYAKPMDIEALRALLQKEGKEPQVA